MHILFWLVYIGINSLMYGRAKGDYFLQLKLQIYYLPAILGATYFTLYFLLPNFLLKKKYLKFTVGFIVISVIFSFLQRINIYLFVIPEFFPKYSENYNIISIDAFFRILLEYPVVIFAASIKILSYWYKNQQHNQQLLQKNLEAELKLLKSQIHPHFLFNTLNNLYALALKKSDLTPDIILKLSDLLNYMLYESNVKTISLKNEIDVLLNYIELEKIRYGKLLDISININGEINNKSISPLLLLSFVENSFKHGISKKISNKWILINFDIEGTILRVRIENSKNNVVNNNLDYSEGIGLKNVKRRLELLYPDKYDLDIQDYGSKYIVILNLELE